MRDTMRLDCSIGVDPTILKVDFSKLLIVTVSFRPELIREHLVDHFRAEFCDSL